MTILVDSKTNAIVQGITGSQGSFHTRLMLNYGTRIVAGVTPGKGGGTFDGVPVYDTVEEAVKLGEATASMIFVPPPGAADAALEAIDARLNCVIIITEGIPVQDAIRVAAEAKKKRVIVIGPNSPGIISPGYCKLGIMPDHVFKKGSVGVISRSGTLTYEIAAGLTRAGLGQSTCLGIGGDPVVGLSFVDILEMFKDDSETEQVVLIGEIGGNAEEVAAEYIRQVSYPKPVVAYIAGRTAPAGKRMGHAGAIIMGRSGSAESKIEALKASEVSVASKPSEIPKLIKEGRIGAD